MRGGTAWRGMTQGGGGGDVAGCPVPLRSPPLTHGGNKDGFTTHMGDIRASVL